MLEDQGFEISEKEQIKLADIFKKQRERFFNNRIAEIKKNTPLKKGEVETLWALLLAAEHPDYLSRVQGHDILYELMGLNIDEELVSSGRVVEGFFYQLILSWSLVWKKYQKDNAAILSSRYVLKMEKMTCNDKVTDYPDAEEELAKEVKKLIPKIDKYIKVPTKTEDILALERGKNGFLCLDDLAINNFSKIYPGVSTLESTQNIKSFYKNSPDLDLRKAKWCHPLYAVRIFAKILWREEVKRKVKLLKEKHPALTLFACTYLHEPLRKNNKVKDGNKIINNYGYEIATLEPPKAEDFPALQLDTLSSMAQRGEKLLSSINTHRLLRWQIAKGTRQTIDGNSNPREIFIEGGPGQLAKEIGAAKGRNTAENLLAILMALSRLKLTFSTPELEGLSDMLSFTYVKARGRQKSLLKITLGDCLMPTFYTNFLGKSLRHREARRLIPIVDLPPFVGRTNEHGAQASFQMEILIEMRKRVKEFIQYGGAIIPDCRLLELAKAAGLKPSLYPKVLDRWEQNGPDGPAFLKRVDSNVYSLDDNYQQARDFLIDAAKMEIKGAERKIKSKSKNR